MSSIIGTAIPSGSDSAEVVIPSSSLRLSVLCQDAQEQYT